MYTKRGTKSFYIPPGAVVHSIHRRTVLICWFIIYVLYEFSENKSINEESEPCLSVTYGPSRKRTEIPIRVIEESDRYTTSDLTYIESGCAGILAHHKWFNPPSDTHTQINYDKLRYLLCLFL